ncbi:MAG: hypothetical protein IJZ90_02335 [Clostridia bacterium]|nr:hypothetical protein [Clostridia bacterium]
MLDVIAMAGLLKGEYKDTFEKANMYATLSNLDIQVYEDRITNLYDKLTEAQSRNDSVEKIIGKDIDSFCKDYFPKKEKQSFWNLLKSYHWIFIWIFVDVLLIALPEDSNISIFDVKIDVFPIVCGMVVGVSVGVIMKVIVKLIKPKVMKQGKMPVEKVTFGIVIGFIVGLIAANLLADSFFGKSAFNVPLWIILIVSGLPVFVVGGGRIAEKICEDKNKKIQRKEEENVRNESENDIEFTYYVRLLASGMAKRFARINRRKEKHGKPVMTMSDFAEKVRKEHRRNRYVDIGIIVIFAVVEVVFSLSIVIESNIFYGIIFFTFISVLYFFAWRVFIKPGNKLADIELYIAEKCEKQGITLDEFVLELNNDNEE